VPTNSFPAAPGDAVAAYEFDRHISSMEDRSRERDRQPPAPTQKRNELVADPVREIGGPKGPEPTRYGDWEHNGRCTDF
jgi:hypothetical protein